MKEAAPTSPARNLRSRWVLALALLPFVLLAGSMMAATSFAFLQTDDFCTFGRVAKASEFNPLLDVHRLYMNWTGRYTAAAIVASAAGLSGVMPPHIVYPSFLAIFLLLFGLACLAVSRLPSLNGKTNIPLALVTFCSVLLLMPSKLEQYLWLTGAAVYFVGASLLLLLIWRLVAKSYSAPALRVELAVGILVVLVVGFNELLALVVGACLAWAAWQDRAPASRHRWPIHAWRLVLFFAALAITVLAPGNFARDAVSATERHDLVGATIMMLDSLALFAESVVRESGWVLLFSLSAAFLAGILGPRSGIRPPRSWLPYLLILLAAFPMQLWVYSFLTGEATPGRVINQGLTLAQVALCLVFAWGGMATRTKSQVSDHVWSISAGLALSGVFMVASSPSREFLSTLSKFAPTWRAQQLERHHGLSTTGEDRPVYVRPFALGDASPPIFAGGDISSNPDDWINKCVADYYGIHSVILMRRSE